MSVARVTTVKKARQDQGQCGKCGTPLPAGSPYLWFKVGFRSHWKQVRCTAPACYPRPSERESSALAGPMSAIESFEDADCASVDDVRDAYEEVKSAFEDYADECESALDSWEYGNSQLEERAEGARAAADALDGFDPDDYYGDFDPDDPDAESDDTADDYDQHVADQKDAALEAINDATGNWV